MLSGRKKEIVLFLSDEPKKAEDIVKNILGKESTPDDIKNFNKRYFKPLVSAGYIVLNEKDQIYSLSFTLGVKFLEIVKKEQEGIETSKNKKLKQLEDYDSRVNRKVFVMQKSEEFFDVYEDKLMVSEDDCLFIDFSLIEKCDINLSEYFINTFSLVDIFEKRAKKYYKNKKLTVHFYNVPKVCRFKLENAKDVDNRNKMVYIEGICLNYTQIMSFVTGLVFRCNYCGNFEEEEYNIMDFMDSPSNKKLCPDCNKHMFIEKQILGNVRLLDVEDEITEESNGVLSKIKVCVSNKLVDKVRYLMNGSKVKITGTIFTSKLNRKSRFRYFLLFANNIEVILTGNDIQITDSEIEMFKCFANRENFLNEFVDSFSPHISYPFEIKFGAICSMVGGIEKREENKTTRGNIHMLLAGDPGTAKSQVLRYIEGISAKARLYDAAKVSGPGLTASVNRDEVTGAWRLNAGVFPLMHNGIALIDEFDKMNPEDRKQINMALEDQMIKIAKASIQASLICKTTMIAACNPNTETRQFNLKLPLVSQLGFGEDLFSRIDLVFFLFDREQNKDRKEIMKRMTGKSDVSVFPRSIVQKYIYFCSKLEPKLTNDVVDLCEKLFEDLRNPVMKKLVNFRYFNTLERLCVASAKIYARDHTVKQDFINARMIFLYALEKWHDDGKNVVIDKTDNSFFSEHIVKNIREERGDEVIEQHFKKKKRCKK